MKGQAFKHSCCGGHWPVDAFTARVCHCGYEQQQARLRRISSISDSNSVVCLAIAFGSELRV